MRVIFLVFLTVLLSSCEKPRPPSPFHAADVSWQHAQADFHLTDFNGKARQLSDFKNKVVVLFFGYTHCPEVCPTTLADLAQVTRLLGAEARQVQVLFITLDPARDDAQLLAKFLPAFDASFLGLYGDENATAQAAQAFGVSYIKQNDAHGNYTLDHSDGIYLLGAGGTPLLLAPYAQRADLLVDDIKLLLALGRNNLGN
jgi:protein SCO1/2